MPPSFYYSEYLARSHVNIFSLSLSLGYGVGHLLAHTVIDCMTHGSPSILFYYYCSYWDLNFLLKIYTTHPCVRCL